MKNKFFKAINLLLVSSMLLSQSSMAFAMNTDGVANNSQPDASLVQPATDEGVATVPNVVEATEPSTEKSAEVAPEATTTEAKTDKTGEPTVDKQVKEEEVAQAEPADSTAVTEPTSGFRNAVAPAEYAHLTEGFAYYIQPQYLGSEKDGDTTYVSWNYKLVYSKLPSFTGQNMDKLYAYMVTTKDSGLGQPQIIRAKKNGSNIPLPKATVSGNADLMKSLKIAVDPKQDVNAPTTTYEFTVKAPVEQIRDVYGADFYAETLFRKPKNTGMFAMQTGTREVLNGRTGSDSNLSAISRTDGVYVRSSDESNGQLSAGDYSSANSITWLVSRFNDTNASQNYPVNISVDDSQTVTSVVINYFKSAHNGNGFVRERQVTSDANISSVNVPAGQIAQVVVNTTVTNEKVNHTLSGSELESLKADLTIQKNWQAGSSPSTTYFKLTGGADNSLNEEITISGSKRSFVKKDMPKFTGFDKTAQRISYRVEEIKKPTYDLVYSSFNEKTLTYTFENKSITKASTPTGLCTEYGVISLDPIAIHEFATEREKNGYYFHDGRLTGRFRIPKGAHSGDYFELIIPRDIDIKHDPDVSKMFFAINDARGRKIGEVFHTETHKLKFILNENAYSTRDYEGTFIVGEKIPSEVRREWFKDVLYFNGAKVERIDGNSNYNTSEEYYQGIQPNRRYFFSSNSTTQDFVRKDLTFKSTYYDRQRANENCEKSLRTPATASFRDEYIRNYYGMHKQMYEITDGYIVYDLIFNPTGVNGWADGLFVDQFSDKIALFSGSNPSSLQTDVQVYEVQGLSSLSYVAGSEKQIWPNREAGTSARVDVRLNNWQGSPSRKNEVYAPLRANKIVRGDHITFNFSGTGRKTMLARVKVKLVPGLESKYDGRVLNFLWTDKPHKFAKSIFDDGPFDFVAHDEVLTTGSANGTVVVNPTLYEFNLQKVDGNSNPITNNPAIFRLSDKDRKTIGEYFTDKNGLLTIGGLKRYIKNRDGSSVGVYYLEEVQAPDGYVREKAIYKIVIDKTGQILFGKKGPQGNEDQNLAPVNSNQPPTFVNKKGYVVRVNKVDDNNGALIGAKFNLRSANASYDFTTPDAKDQSSFTFYNLAPGEYTLTEVESPSGYVGIKNPITFTVNENGDVALTSAQTADVSVDLNEIERVFEISVVNKKAKTGEFSLTKVSDKQEVLADAIFKLTPLSPAGTPIEKTSNSTGKVHFAKLKPGRYRLEEKAAPDGYKKTDLTWIVEVNDQGQTTVKVESTQKPVTNTSPNPAFINFEVVNKKEKQFGFALPETGGSGVMAIKVIGLGVILGAAFLLMRKKKKR